MSSSVRVGLYSESDVIGGAERSMLTLAAAYRGEPELVIVSPSTAVVEAAAEFAPTVERRLMVSTDGRTGGFLAHRRAFAGLDLDLVQVTLPSPFAARTAQLAAFSLRLPTVVVQQLVLAPRRRRGALLARVFALPLSGIVAVGKRSATDLERLYGMSPSKIHVAYNGIPTPAPSGPELDRRPVIGCVARYESQKALDRLIRAVAELPEARLVLAGDGALREDLVGLAKELQVEDRVEIGPWRDDARALISGFDIFALSSVDEAFPLTIVEAMLAGVPVVATDVGSVGEAVIDGETGVLVRSGDHDGLVAGLRRLLDDSELARELGLGGKRRAEERFTAAQMAESYDAVWRSVLNLDRA